VPAPPAESLHFIGFLHGLFSLTNS